jgi:mono/diheme cytochrome c family protein
VGIGDVTIRIGTAACLALLVSGCGVSMTQQPKYNTYDPAKFWTNGASARPLSEGVVAQSDLAFAETASSPPHVTVELLKRGRERFDIFCAPCHGLTGQGDGIIVKHGFPNPPPYDSPKLLSAPAQHFYDVITNGYGVMYSYAARVEPHDRWAIAAYIRALQLSHHATISQTPDAREKLP